MGPVRWWRSWESESKGPAQVDDELHPVWERFLNPNRKRDISGVLGVDGDGREGDGEKRQRTRAEDMDSTLSKAEWMQEAELKRTQG